MLGHLLAVSAEIQGDEVIVAGGDTGFLTVGDGADFDEDGGWVSIAGTLYAYSGFTDAIVNGYDEPVTLSLLAPFPGAPVAVETRVDVWSPDDANLVVEYVGHVILDGQDNGDPVQAAIDHALIPLLPQTIRPDGGNAVTLEWDGDDLVVKSPSGKVPVQDASYVDPRTLPDPIPVTAPTSSPAVTVTGIPGGLIVRADPVAPSTLIEYHVSTTSGFTPSGLTQVGVDTRATVVVVEHMPDGSPLVEGVSYFVRTVATNVAGSAPAGVEATGQMDMTAVAALIVSELVAGFILAGRITVGVAYWDADEGLVFPQPDGGVIRFPVDGVTAAQITAHLVAKSLTVEDNANFYGITQLFGTLKMSNGITNPVVKPGVSRTWSKLDTAIVGGSDTASHYGLLWESALSRWTTVAYSFGPAFQRYNNTTGAITNNTSFANANYFPQGGVTLLGGNYYVLGRDVSRDDRWFVKKLNSSLVEVAEWEYTNDSGSPYNPTISNDGTNLIIARCSAGDGKPRVRAYSTTGTLGSTTICDTAMNADLTGVYVGSADFGAARVVCASPTSIRVFNSSGVRQTSHEWGRAGGINMNGLAWDGTNFHTLDEQGHIWHYTATVTSQSVDVAYTWYDGNATGTTHESMVGPTSTFTWPARSQLFVTMPTAPEFNVAGTDRANQHRGYAGPAAGTLRLQATPAVGTTSFTLDVLDTVSATPPASNGFAAIGATPGTIVSAAVDGSSVPFTQLNGDGSGRLMKMMQHSSFSFGTFPGVGSANALTQAVTFAVPFAATPIVQVATPGDPDLRRFWVSGVSATGFTLNAYRTSGTAGFVVAWSAFATTQ